MLKFKQVLAGFGFASLLTAGSMAQAATTPILTQGFDGLALGAVPANWIVVNRSALPADNWGGGNSNLFAAQAGAPGSYIADSFEAGGGSGIVSDWLLSPVVTIGNGYSFSFYTRGDVDTATFPDSLQLRVSTNGASTNVGTSPTGVGDFTMLLVSVNPTLAPAGFPTDWTQFTGTVSNVTGLTTGRFALRYSLANDATQGSYIGVDSIVITAVPEPETMLMLALGLGVMGISLRNARRSRV